MTDITLEVNIAATAIDDEPRMCKIRFLNKTSCCAGAFLDIIPFRSRTIANRNIWTRVIRFLFLATIIKSRSAAIPISIEVF